MKMNRKQARCGASAGMFLALMAQTSIAADFIMLNDPALSSGFEQRWNHPAIWQYVSGVDDGTAGIPDGADTFTIDRNTGGFPANNTDLSNEGMPIHSIAAITGTGAPGHDLILKYAGGLTIGDLIVLASASTFEIEEERDDDLTINGVISGAGDLVLSRAGGFSDGVTPDEFIMITGAVPNTITGTMRLYNSNGGGQPSYWVADKVGAFGQVSELTLEGRASLSGVASLQITANTSGGEGAIDDDATTVYLGAEAVLSMDTGVDEKIGLGKLFIDLTGTGTYTEVPEGIYDNTEDWIIGDGTVTVGSPPDPNLFVTTLLDVIDEFDGDVSLREAVTYANSNADQSDISFDPAIAGGTVTLDAGLGQLALTSDLSVDGDTDGDEKADITLSGGDAIRLFRISGGSTDITLRSLTITQGNSNDGFGGAIYQTGGTLLIVDATLSDSDAGTRSGGAISSAFANLLELRNVLLTGNTASQAGAITIQDTDTSVLRNVTVAGNTAANSGALTGYALNNDISIEIVNSTFADNIGGTIRLIGSGGATVDTVTATLSNTVLATAANNGSVQQSTNGGFINLTGDYCFHQAGSLIGTGNILSPSAPGLAALAANGGPTQTMAIEAGSVLIDAGDPTFDPNNFTPALTTDQRGTGFDRVTKGLASSPAARVDIGAFELVNDFASWISGFFSEPEDITFGADPDLDGIGNAFENFLGSAPDEFSQGLVVSTAASGIFTATHSQSNSPAIDVVVDYEWSSDLATWQSSGETDTNGVSVTIEPVVSDDQVAPANDTVEVTATVTGGATGRLFLRLAAPEP